MTPRDRRLHTEYADMRQLARASSMVTFTVQGLPPTRYDVVLTCRGLVRTRGLLTQSAHHEFSLTLGRSFPLLPPEIIWKTPVFHPNIVPPRVCTGDIWYPGMSVAELCVQLCELVQYKSFNIYDPLDGTAALWLGANLEADEPVVPIDPTPVRDLAFDLDLRPRTAPAGPPPAEAVPAVPEGGRDEQD
ncbi:ubiquitin-conjugating enzyme E2 [Micromonospora rifamycinica]|uniref:ubiquitin-conjugating enzyme E2 n=1 Tax=Micromonospora rifamycinica TaxID=291594 RepID=UPI00340D0AAA